MADWQRELIVTAQAAREQAYAPYSQIGVGAALLTQDGVVFRGCNIENAAYSATICAERVAFAQAVSAGQRDFRAIAIVGGCLHGTGGDLDYFYPCGSCRQWMAEFCGPEFVILAAKSPEDYRRLTLAELLPHSFGPGHLKA